MCLRSDKVWGAFVPGCEVFERTLSLPVLAIHIVLLLLRHGSLQQACVDEGPIKPCTMLSLAGWLVGLGFHVTGFGTGCLDTEATDRAVSVYAEQR